MRWPADVVARAALDAGYRKTDAITAVAVALATSRGDDQFNVRYPTGCRYLYVGAWGIPGPLPCDDVPPALWTLRGSAKAAYGLSGASGDDWEWSAAWRLGAHTHWLGIARAAVDRPSPGFETTGAELFAPLNGLAGALDDATVRAHRAVNSAVDYRPIPPIL